MKGVKFCLIRELKEWRGVWPVSVLWKILFSSRGLSVGFSSSWMFASSAGGGGRFEATGEGDMFLHCINCSNHEFLWPDDEVFHGRNVGRFREGDGCCKIGVIKDCVEIVHSQWGNGDTGEHHINSWRLRDDSFFEPRVFKLVRFPCKVY